MGYNLISGCHKCKVSKYHDRGEENKTILQFYHNHKLCAEDNVDNVRTVMDNNGNDPEFFEYPEQE